MSQNISQMPGEQPYPDFLGLISYLQNRLDGMQELYSASEALNASITSEVYYLQIQLQEAKKEVDRLRTDNERLNLTLNHLVPARFGSPPASYQIGRDEGVENADGRDGTTREQSLQVIGGSQYAEEDHDHE